VLDRLRQLSGVALILTSIPAVLRLILSISLDDLRVGCLEVLSSRRLHLHDRFAIARASVRAADRRLAVGVDAVHVDVVECGSVMLMR